MLPVERKQTKFSKGNQCSFWHEGNDRAQNPKPNAATPSEPSFSRGRSVSKKRSIKGRSNHGAILRQSCRCFLKVLARDRLVSIGILSSVNFTKQKRCAKPVIGVCSRTTRLTNNRTKSRKKRPFTNKKRKQRQECSGYFENCISDVLCLARLGVIGFSKKQKSPWKPNA